MSPYRYVLFGAGRQGTAAVHDLVLNCEAEHVLVVEPDAARRKAAEARLKGILKKRASALSFAASAKVSDLRGTHGALSCATHYANVELTQLALSAGVPFTDLGGNYEVVSKQEALARKSSVPVVPDCGISPGISNIVAAHCAKVHGCDEVHVRCGGLPLERPSAIANPLQYKLVFSPWGLLSEYSGDVARIRNGKAGTWPALSVTEEFDAEHESSPTSNNSPQVVDYLRECGVTTYDYMTIRYKGHWDLVRGWKTLGFLKRDKARDAQLVELLESDPVLQYDPKHDRDKLILRVQGSKRANGLTRGIEYRFDVAADKKTKFSAMELTTCWGITIVAHHIASGRGAPKGFSTPERFVDTTWVIAEVEKRLAQVR
ncbi:MAG: saccharopine dehydrogenase NADP-binding domain-containing protein [Planctomycetes bacterium]|nr:saccharopine dehydrogenase NADP-binding domain-containing protein [Planctomycetota bacterium]